MAEAKPRHVVEPSSAVASAIAMARVGVTSRLRGVRSRTPLAGAALFAYLVLTLGVFVSQVSGPTIFEDEHGPIETARALAGQQLIADTKYHPGYGLMLLPGVMLADSAYDEYRLALATNVLLIAGSAFVLFLASNRSLDISPWRVALAIGAAYSIPYVTSSAGLVWSEASLIAIAALLAAAVFEYDRTRRSWLALLIGVLAGSAFLFHPRMVAAIPAVLVATVLIPTDNRARTRSTIITGTGAATGLLAAFITRSQIVRATGAASTYETPQVGFDAVGSIPDLVSILLGRASTEMLALVALPLIAIALPPARRTLLRMRPVLGFGVVFAVLILGYTAVSTMLSGIARPDFLYYSRYQGPGMVVVAALAALAIAAVQSRASFLSWRRHSLLVAGYGLAFLTIALLTDPSVFERQPVLANVPELASLQTEIRPGWVFLVVVLATSILLLIGELPLARTYVLISCQVLGLGLSAAWFIGSAYPGSEGRAAERDLVPYFSVLQKEDCVLYEASSFSFWNRANYEFFSDARFVDTDSAADSGCGPLLLVGNDTSEERDIESNFVFLAREPVPDLELYLLTSGPFDSPSYQITEANSWYLLDRSPDRPQAQPEHGVAFLSGWHEQSEMEPFRWSDGAESTLHLLLADDIFESIGAPLEVQLDLQPFLAPSVGLTEQIVTVYVNGEQHSELKVAKPGAYSVPINSSDVSNSLTLTFSYTSHSRPCDHGISADCRVLALGLLGVKVSQGAT